MTSPARTSPSRWALFLAAAILASGLRGAPAIADTLYADLGSQIGIRKIVDGTFSRVLQDKRIADEFDDINFDRLKDRVTLLLCQVSGGPCKYPGRDMRATHKGLHLDSAQFNAFVEDMQDSMDAVGIPFRTQNRFLAILAPMQRDIVSR